MQLKSHRDEEAKKRIDKYIRVREFAVQDDGQQVKSKSKDDNNEIKLVDVLQDLQTKDEIVKRCKCIKKTKIVEQSDDDSEEIDEL